MDNAEQDPLLSEAAPPVDDVECRAVCSDWLGRPSADDRADRLGGWKCSSCVLGVYGFGSFAYSGICLNLVTYLVQVCGMTNANAASAVSSITGTTFLFCFIGAFVGETSIGHLKAYLIFEILTTLSYASVFVAVLFISEGPATSTARAYFLGSLYLMGITGGTTLPFCIVLGASQLTTVKQKEKFFRLWIIPGCVGQLLSVTLVSYIESGGMWVWGFGLCTLSATVAMVLFVAMVSFFRQYKASGNPFLQIVQVAVAAWRKRLLSLSSSDHNSDYLLCENQGSEVSSISAHQQLKPTSILSFLDRAAVLGPSDANNQHNPWHLCTVTQVEELKSLLRVIPGGMVVVLTYATYVQSSTLFVEQAVLMNRQVTTWLAIPAASLNLFSLGTVILSGAITTTCGATLIRWCRPGRRVKEGHGISASTSLHLQSAALLCCITVMGVAALVESHRLRAAQEGTILSVLWLVPQTVLVGIAYYLATTGGANFFYSEVPDSMRAVSSSVFIVLQGVGSYLSSLLVTVVTAITTQGGKAGWIASDLNEGHVDYFYWFMACCVAVTLGIFLVYTHNYTSIRVYTSQKKNIGSL